MELAIEVLKELFKRGADPNEKILNSCWHSRGGLFSAFQIALCITKRIIKRWVNCDNICCNLVKVFLDAGANVDNEMCQPIWYMRTEGVIRSTILHRGLIDYPVSIIRQFLVKVDVDKRKLQLIASEHGSG